MDSSPNLRGRTRGIISGSTLSSTSTLFDFFLTIFPFQDSGLVPNAAAAMSVVEGKFGATLLALVKRVNLEPGDFSQEVAPNPRGHPSVDRGRPHL